MRSRSVALCLTIFLSCLGLTSAGCSVIGYEIGKSIDNGSPNRSVDRLQIPGISQGTTVQVVKNDCEVLQCTFLGTDTLPLAEYARAYSGGLRESERTDSLPSIGEKVYVDAQIANRENRYEGEFLGLDRRSMWLRQGGQTCSAQLDLRCVKRLLRENGVVVTGPNLRDLSLDASIPSMYIIRIEVEGHTLVVGLDDVKEIVVPSSKTATWVGSASGFVLDCVAVGLIVGVVIPTIDQWKHWGN
jgi:hypothetical protein